MPRHMILGLLVLVFTPVVSRSAVFERDWVAPGDGLLTYDDVNQREWLDLTETQLFNFPGNTLQEQYAAVVAHTASGSEYSEFLVAMEDDVRALAESAGINTTTLDFEANGASASIVIDLLGNTIDRETPTKNTRSGGFVATSNQELASVWMTFNSNSRAARNAGFRDLSGELERDFGFFGPPPLLETSGVWLYRQIPEPSTFALLVVPFVVLVLRPPRSYHNETG